MWRVIVSTVAIAGLGFLASQIPSEEAQNVRVKNKLEVVVTKVSDGDTIAVSGDQRIRLCGIDAPESSQALGKESKAYLEQMISREIIEVDEIQRDRYDRIVGEIFLGDNPESQKLINAEMVAAGMAYIYPQYINQCPNAGALMTAEAIAKEQRLGVWGGNYQKPWDYRKSKR